MEFKLTLNESDLQILDKALVQMPYVEVFSLINKVNEQIQEQTFEEESEENQV